MTAINSDRSFYQVIQDTAHGPLSGETLVADMTFTQLIKDIEAKHYVDVIAVYEFNPFEGWSQDVTADVMAALDETGGDDCQEHRITSFEAGVGRNVA